MDGGESTDWTSVIGKISSAITANPAGVQWFGRYRTGSLQKLIGQFVGATGGAATHWEPHGYTSIVEASKLAFGVAAAPRYDVATAQTIVSFGANFLQTWLSPLHHSKGWGEARGLENGPIAEFYAIEPRVSHSSARADTWYSTAPGTEAGVAMALAKLVADRKHTTGTLAEYVSGVDAASNAAAAGVSIEKLNALADKLAGGTSIVFPGGVANAGINSTDLALATLVLNGVCGNIGTTVHIGATRLGQVDSYSAVGSMLESASNGDVSVLFVDGLNPSFNLPSSANFSAAAANAGMVVVLGNSMPEGMPANAILLPTGSAIESWGDSASASDFMGLQQPAMRKLYDTKSVGDSILAIAKAAALSTTAPVVEDTEAGADESGVVAVIPGVELNGTTAIADFTAVDFQHYVAGRWFDEAYVTSGSTSSFPNWWNDALIKGGVTVDAAAATTDFVSEVSEISNGSTIDGTALMLFPHSHLGDGRHANKAWLQEVPDPMSGYSWGTWAEISVARAADLGVDESNTLTISNGNGEITVGVRVSKGMRDDAVAVVVGNGHTSGNRYSAGYGSNPATLVDLNTDAKTGDIAWLGTVVTVSKGADENPLTNLKGSESQEGRPVARASYSEDVMNNPHGETGSLAPGLIIPKDPRIEAAGLEYDMYPEPEHPTYRFGMTLDLDKCTGCGACEVACLSENNIPSVGPEQARNNRYMGWIRLDRFWEGEGENPDVRFVPVMCQHCSHAPCEGVCPVMATYHNMDGLNAMIYNRCVGTRYCSNNCPYSARRFNYHTFRWPEAYNLMLNPDVSTREMGVIEKCSFCIQRIRYVKATWSAAGHDIVSDIALQTLPACAETCPADAIVFGNLKDEEAAVSKIAAGPRAYQLFDSLNTKPGVRYLSKVTFQEPVDPHHGSGHEESNGDEQADGHGGDDHSSVGAH
jgi:molybdopterin-containing oxidoreductase family iron-sulfur binding subunit